MKQIIWLNEIKESDKAQVGGKAFNLSRLIQANLNVPQGFVITSKAIVEYQCKESQEKIATLIHDHYVELHAETVAVRSSALDEDSDHASHAGQYKSVLHVKDRDELLVAIEECIAAGKSESVRQYKNYNRLRQNDNDQALIVQKMIEADSAGVCFTINPHDKSGKSLLIEAVRGFGDKLVSGQIKPEQYKLNRATGEVITFDTEAEMSCESILNKPDLSAIYKAAQKIFQLSETEQDIEWAIESNDLYLLQTRTITAPTEFEREQHRKSEIERISQLNQAMDTLWVRDNLYESVTCPTPLTWSILSKMLSANGGLGRAFEQLGAKPDRHFSQDSVYDLILGRPYISVEKLSHLYSSSVLNTYGIPPGKTSPEIIPNAWKYGWKSPFMWMQFIYRHWQIDKGFKKAAMRIKTRFSDTVLPKAEDQLSTYCKQIEKVAEQNELCKIASSMVEWIINDLACELLQPGLIADYFLARLPIELNSGRKEDDATIISKMLGSVQSQPRIAFHSDLRLWSDGHHTLQDIRKRYFHYGQEAYELSSIRYEDLSDVELQNVLVKEFAAKNNASKKLEELFTLTTKTQEIIVNCIELREIAKDLIVRAIVSLRSVLRKIEQEKHTTSHLYWKTIEEIVGTTNTPTEQVVRFRQRTYAINKLFVPKQYIWRENISQIGLQECMPRNNQAEIYGDCISHGVAEGVICTLETLISAKPDRAILILEYGMPEIAVHFHKLEGIIVEKCGILSHFAILAREACIPVIGVNQATTIFQQNEEVKFNADLGRVYRDATNDTVC